MTRGLVSSVLLLALSNATFGQITEWTGRQFGTDYTINSSINIVILQPGTFKFQSVSGSALAAIGN